MPYGKLEVYVEGAVQIKDTSILGKGSPYCTLTVGTQVYSTPPNREGGALPYFNTKFEFHVDRTTNQLMVQIYSKKSLTNDDLLGYCTILLKDAFYHSPVVPVTPYALTRPSGLPGGHIRLSLTFTAQPRPQLLERPPQPSSNRPTPIWDSDTSDWDVSVDRVATASHGSAHMDNVYYEIHGAVASSSGHGGMEEHVTRSMKKVQSKDLKSGRLIGKGPSSIVYETKLEGKSYARKDFLRVPSDIFEKEAAALVGLDHPNVLRTYCWTVDEGSCSLVLELMDDDLLNMMQQRKDSQRKKPPGSGSASQTSHLIDLHKFIEKGRNTPTGNASESAAAAPPVYPFNMPEALHIMLQIAEGMKFLHDKGVAHGDLKPKNILVKSSGRVASSSLDQSMAFEFKVADFGLVGTKMKSRTLVSRRARKLEMVRWQAPELLNLSSSREDEHESSTDSDWDSDSSYEVIGVHVQNFTFMDMANADVYNFGLTCSQILHGEEPYSGLGVNDLVNQITFSGVRPELPPTCPGQLSDLIKLCWGQKTDRPSFQDILSELKDLQASFTRTDAVENNKKNSITEPSSSRIDSFELELVPEISAIPRQPSGGPGGSSHSSPGLEIYQTVEVPTVDEELLIKDTEADNSKGTLVREKRRIGRKAFGILRKARSSLTRKMMSEEQKWLKRRAPELEVLHRFSSGDIKRMTNNFNNDNVIRREEGRYTVYRGIEEYTGATCAVMSLQKGFKVAFHVLKIEIEMLSQVHHNNVVGLVGFCFEKAEHMLVYEYLPNARTLRDWLLGSKSETPLDWDRRLGIALGAAKGLAHLHNTDPPIIHRDVNSRNILVDKKRNRELNAKVKLNFGLSLLVPYEKDGSLKPTKRNRLYRYSPFATNFSFHMRPINKKSDVYSFGVVLLELLTGRSPVRPYVVMLVRNRYEAADIAAVKELLDPALADIEEKELRAFLKIALMCVEDTSLERPSMPAVVKQLETLVDSILLQYSTDLQLALDSVKLDRFKIFLTKSWED